jgi:hypothetical protein
MQLWETLKLSHYTATMGNKVWVSAISPTPRHCKLKIYSGNREAMGSIPITGFMTKIVTYEIEYCNSGCPHFYHNYEDDDNVWCCLLDKKIFEFNESVLLYGDRKKRTIPEECPLPDVG